MRFFGLCPQNDVLINNKFLLTYLPTNLLTRKRRVAFTLAEVLITLGVIGVVASLTMPTLIKNHEKRVIETQLAKTYSDLTNLMLRSQLENDHFTTWDFSMSVPDIVDTYFAPYIKLTPCSRYHNGISDKCFVTNGAFTTWYYPTNTSKRGEFAYTNSTVYHYLMNDGRAIAFWKEYHSDNNIFFFDIVVDVNGKKGRTVMGQDIFLFSLNNIWGITNRLKVGHAGSLSENQSTEYLINNCLNMGPGTFTAGACTHLLERNGWKFPKDYPIKF